MKNIQNRQGDGTDSESPKFSSSSESPKFSSSIKANFALIGTTHSVDSEDGDVVDGHLAVHLRTESDLTEKMRLILGFMTTLDRAGLSDKEERGYFFTHDTRVGVPATAANDLQAVVELEFAHIDYSIDDNWSVKYGFKMTYNQATGNYQLQPLSLTSLITHDFAFFGIHDGGNPTGGDATTEAAGVASVGVPGKSLTFNYVNDDSDGRIPIKGSLSLFSRTSAVNNTDEILTKDGIDTISLFIESNFIDEMRTVIGVAVNDAGKDITGQANTLYKYKCHFEYEVSDQIDTSLSYNVVIPSSQTALKANHFLIAAKYKFDSDDITVALANNGRNGQYSQKVEVVYSMKGGDNHSKALGFTQNNQEDNASILSVWTYWSFQMK